MLKSSIGPHCMQCKERCQGFAEGVAEVLIPNTRRRQEKVPPTGVAAKNSVHIESIEAADAKQNRKRGIQ
jgi:hypothetical protein